MYQYVLDTPTRKQYNAKLMKMKIHVSLNEYAITYRGERASIQYVPRRKKYNFSDRKWLRTYQCICVLLHRTQAHEQKWIRDFSVGIARWTAKLIEIKAYLSH